jgi:hypothetical protein
MRPGVDGGQAKISSAAYPTAPRVKNQNRPSRSRDSSALALVITTPAARTANRRARAVSDSSIVVAALHPMVSTE